MRGLHPTEADALPDRTVAAATKVRTILLHHPATGRGGEPLDAVLRREAATGGGTDQWRSWVARTVARREAAV